MIFENDEFRSELISALRNREDLELGWLTYDRQYAEHFFFFQGDSDCWRRKDKTTSKVKMLTSICGKLGFSSWTAKAVLRRVTDMIELNNERNQMIVSMGDIAPVFV